ncbi:MAG: mechanosensitive ion channel family protein [Actinomycetota bacterium]|nr:mechanosensitive ion channel family protein [Actinomycetota bacterium]
MPISLLSVFAQVAPTAAEPGSLPCGAAGEASSLCLSIYRSTGNGVLAQLSDSLVVRPARIAFILAVAYVARRVLYRLLGRLISGRARRVETVAALFRSITSAAVWTVAGLMALSELGLNLGPLIAGAGIVGVAVGFGAQNLVRDFLSGIFMLMEDQYGVGDEIDAGPATGTVESISLRTTRLRDVNGTVWHLPNGHIERVGNRSQQWSRAVLDIDVSYQTDIAHATDVIKGTAQTMCEDPEFAGSILAEPEVWGVEDLGVDSVTIRLVLKTAPHDQLKVTRELRARIKRAFDEAGIEIPFAQRTIWHRSGAEGAVAVLPRSSED